jgi:hypothetical protein
MGQPIEITRTEHSASDLRAIAAKCRDGARVRRLLALALVLEGVSRTEAAERSGMERQTPRDWVHRYNAEGIEGLKSGHGPGQAPALTAARMAEPQDLALKGRSRYCRAHVCRPPSMGQLTHPHESMS